MITRPGVCHESSCMLILCLLSYTAVAFGAIKTRLTQAPKGEYVVRPDGTKQSVGFHGGYDEEEKWLVS